MRPALAYVLALGLLVFVGAHLAIVVALARRRDYQEAALAFFVPPLAPFYAAERGLRALVWAWLAGVVVYVVTLFFA